MGPNIWGIDNLIGVALTNILLRRSLINRDSGDVASPIRSGLLTSILRWVNSDAGADALPNETGKRTEWLRILPFIILHGMCLGVIWVGASGIALAAPESKACQMIRRGFNAG